MIQIIATCTGPVKIITTIVKAIITLLQIIAPILLIISLIKSFTQLVINPDDKKNKGGKAIFNAAIATIIVFFIPYLVGLVLNLVNENNSFTTCWKSSGQKINNTTEYTNPNNEKDRKNILPNQNDYEKGK